VNLEVWNNARGRLLARRSLAATRGVETIRLPVDAQVNDRAAIYSGWGPFRARLPGTGSKGERLEVRVWTPGGAGTVNVYLARLVRAAGP
jgi:hypothetical protein